MPSISAITAGSLGLRASKISVTAGNVLRAGHLARRLGQQRAGRNRLAFRHFDVRSLGHVVEVENFATGILEHHLRVQVALVFGDDHADVAAGVLFQADGFAFDDVLVADLAADFRQDRDAVRVPLAEDRAGLDFPVLLDQ
jgi:hypothetical protein